MTIRELFDRVRALPGASADEDMMLMWLNDCEGVIFHEILETREGFEDGFDGYSDEDLEAELLAADPYSVLYVYYVVAQTYLSFADIDRYNNFLALYRDAYDEFAGFWARNHRQKLDAEVKL